VDNAGQKALKQVAEAGGGVYATVRSQEELKRQFEQEKAKVEQEWSDWWRKNRMAMGEQSRKKFDEIGNLIGAFDGEFPLTKRREIKRMFEAKEYLEVKGIISGDEVYVLNEKIMNRDNVISDYIVEWEEKLWDEVVEKEEQTADEIDKTYENRDP